MMRKMFGLSGHRGFVGGLRVAMVIWFGQILIGVGFSGGAQAGHFGCGELIALVMTGGEELLGICRRELRLSLAVNCYQGLSRQRKEAVGRL